MEEKFGKYQLTQTQLIAEIRKTDKMLAKFYQILKELREYKDKSNSSQLGFALESLKDFEIPGEDNND